MKDFTGQEFGRWRVEGSAGEKDKHGNRLWNVICKCGAKDKKAINNLKRGLSQSCGCLAKELLSERKTTHGMAKKEQQAPEYRTWYHMKSRCMNENDPKYPRYGARGITVCDEWVNDFNIFFLDMGKKPGKGYSIGRIDNDKGYFKENCRWENDNQQSRNRHNTTFLQVNEETRPIGEWSEISGIRVSTIHNRLKSGWSAYDAVFEPYKFRRS